MARNSRASEVKREFKTNDELLEMLTRDAIRAKIKEMVRFIFSELPMPFGEDESLQLHVNYIWTKDPDAFSDFFL